MGSRCLSVPAPNRQCPVRTTVGSPCLSVPTRNRQCPVRTTARSRCLSVPAPNRQCPVRTTVGSRCLSVPAPNRRCPVRTTVGSRCLSVPAPNRRCPVRTTARSAACRSRHRTADAPSGHGCAGSPALDAGPGGKGGNPSGGRPQVQRVLVHRASSRQEHPLAPVRPHAQVHPHVRVALKIDPRPPHLPLGDVAFALPHQPLQSRAPHTARWEGTPGWHGCGSA